MKKAICEFCGKEYEYDENNIRVREEGRKDSYDSSRFCCFHCFSKERVRKQKETLSKRLGYEVTSTFHLPGVQEKAQATSLKRYGTKFGVCSKQSVEKRRKTCKERYGVEVPLQNKEIKQKTYDSNIKNHNGTYHLQTEEVREKCAEGHRTDEYREKNRQRFDVEYRRQQTIKKYGVDTVFKLKEVQEKCKRSCLKKFGVDNPLKNKEVSAQMSKTKFLRNAINLENLNKDFLIENFVKDDSFKLESCAKYFNFSEAAVEFFKKQFNIDVCNETPRDKTLECELFTFIKGLTTHDIIRHDRCVISPLELDIYIPELKIAFEFNGNYWHSFNFNGNKCYHYNKTLLCEKAGIRLVHIWEYEWVNEIEKVKSFIKNVLQCKKQDISTCKVNLITDSDYLDFTKKFGVENIKNASYFVGLFDENDNLLSVMTFIYDTLHVTWAIRSFVCSDVYVKGAFEKLFEYFLQYKKPKKVLVDIDLAKSCQDVYIDNGFVVEKDLPSDYFWIINDKYYEREVARLEFKKDGDSKVKFKNRMLKTALQCYDAGKRRLIWNKS